MKHSLSGWMVQTRLIKNDINGSKVGARPLLYVHSYLHFRTKIAAILTKTKKNSVWAICSFISVSIREKWDMLTFYQYKG